MNTDLESQDFYSMTTGLNSLKLLSGLAQIIFGLIAYVVNYFFLKEDFVTYGAYGTFAIGLFLVGVKDQTLVSPSRKLVRTTKGFFFFVKQRDYSASMINKVQVSKKTSYGKDGSGIGPSNSSRLVTTFYVELVLTNTKKEIIYSGSKVYEVNAFATRVATAMNVEVVTL